MTRRYRPIPPPPFSRRRFSDDPILMLRTLEVIELAAAAAQSPVERQLVSTVDKLLRMEADYSFEMAWYQLFDRLDQRSSDRTGSEDE